MRFACFAPVPIIITKRDTQRRYNVPLNTLLPGERCSLPAKLVSPGKDCSYDTVPPRSGRACSQDLIFETSHL
jgi:hypothetical protein